MQDALKKKRQLLNFGCKTLCDKAIREPNVLMDNIIKTDIKLTGSAEVNSYEIAENMFQQQR
jgi:hypothetical protein